MKIKGKIINREKETNTVMINLSNKDFDSIIKFGYLPLDCTLELEENPAYYCFMCDVYLGFRGFCSTQCHNDFYDSVSRVCNLKNKKA